MNTPSPLQALDAAHSEECAAFVEWNRAFERRCRALGCISADALLAGADSPSAGIDWIESPQWRPAARRRLQQHARVLLPQPKAKAESAIVRATSAAAELAAMADWARGNLAEEGFRAWICVPDLNRRRAEVVDAFDAALVPRRFALRAESGAESGAAPYAVAGGTPLADYAPVRAALAFLAASVGKVTFVQFSALLRAPELQDGDSEVSSAARLDVALRRRASDDADLASWLELAERAARNDARRTGGCRTAVARGRSGYLRNCTARGTSASGLPSGWMPWRPVPGRFAAAGRASNIKQRSDSASCSPA